MATSSRSRQRARKRDGHAFWRALRAARARRHPSGERPGARCSLRLSTDVAGWRRKPVSRCVARPACRLLRHERVGIRLRAAARRRGPSEGHWLRVPSRPAVVERSGLFAEQDAAALGERGDLPDSRCSFFHSNGVLHVRLDTFQRQTLGRLRRAPRRVLREAICERLRLGQGR